MLATGTPASLIIFVVTIGVSLLGLYKWPQIIEGSLFRPYYFLRKKQYFTLIASGFTHADMMHLLFNMMTFYFFAFQLERQIGTVYFVVLYALGLVLSLAGTYWKHRNNPQYASLGASGAISAVLFAFVVYFPYESFYIIPIPIPIPAPLFAVGYLAYTYYSARRQVGRINHDAHLDGALVGLAFVAITDFSAYQRLLS